MVAAAGLRLLGRTVIGVALFAVALVVAQRLSGSPSSANATRRAELRRHWIVQQLRFDERLLAELTHSGLTREEGCLDPPGDTQPGADGVAPATLPGPVSAPTLPSAAQSLQREGIARCAAIWKERPRVDFAAAERAAAQHAATADLSAVRPSPVKPLRVGVGQALLELGPLLARLVAALLALLAVAAVAGAAGSLSATWRPRRRRLLRAGLLVGLSSSLLPMLQPALFHVRAASPGGWLGQLLFVAAFAGAALRVSLRPLLDPGPAQAFLCSTRGRPDLGLAARRAAAAATSLLLPFVPAATVAALLAQVKAARPAGEVYLQGLGGRILDLIHAQGRQEAMGIGLLVLASLLLVVFSGHALLREARSVLAPAGELRREGRP